MESALVLSMSDFTLVTSKVSLEIHKYSSCVDVLLFFTVSASDFEKAIDTL